MSDRSQIGPAVDADLWQRFREDVKARKGQVRGVLGDELENAIRDYLSDGPDPEMRRFNQRLARIEEAVGVSSADGGTHTLPDDSHTHAPTDDTERVPDEKPSPNAPTEKKVRWLAAQIRKDVGENFEEVHPTVLREVVKDTYGFRRDTAKRYVEELREYFDLVEHPGDYPTLVTHDRREDWIKQQRQEREKAAEEEVLEKL